MKPAARRFTKLKISIALLLSIFVSTVTGQVAATSQRPLTLGDVVNLLKGGVPPKRVTVIVHDRSVDFSLNDDAEKQIRTAGGDDALLLAVTKYTKVASASAPQDKLTAPLQVPSRREESKIAGAVKVNPLDGLPYVWIPPGRFQMGCSPGDSECDTDEKPVHEVTISKGFWMGQTAVTQAAYEQVTGMNPSHFHGDRLPVESVTWDEAKTYCGVVGMRLPTEAEWEYAARAGSTAARYGDIDSIAWYADNSGNGRIKIDSEWGSEDYYNKLKANGNSTKPVGQKQANAWRLYDMLGNVWQWTADRYYETYYTHDESRDPTGPTTGKFRTLRGGSWYFFPHFVRVSVRGGTPTGLRYASFGFRCAGE